MISNPVSRLAFAAALAIGIGDSASAGEAHRALPQLAGVTTGLDNHVTALTYWVDAADGLHVVTTIDTDLGDKTAPTQARHAVVRFSAQILPGQAQVISVPGPAGSPQQALRIRRFANRFGAADIEVDRVPASATTAGADGLTN